MSLGFSRRRQRITPVQKYGVVSAGHYNPAVTDSGVFKSWSPSFYGEQTFDNRNAFFSKVELSCDEIHKGPPYYSGGPFKTLKADWMTPYDVVGRGVYVRNDNRERYIGGFTSPQSSVFGEPNYSNWPLLLGPCNSTLFPSMSDYGAKAWNKLKPKVEKASAMVFLTEWRDVPHMLHSTSRGLHEAWQAIGGQPGKLMQPKHLADQFLNHQFGWVPFLNDLQGFNRVYHNTQNLLRDLTDKNDKWQKRKGTILEKTETKIIDSGIGCKVSPNFGVFSGYVTSDPTWEVERVQTTKINAVGSFKIYRPEFDQSLTDFNSAWNNIQRQLDLYGLRISPSNIYRATPWTWAADWVSDAGNYVSYISDTLVDNLACKYFYLMQHQHTSLKFRQVLPTNGGAVTLEWTRVIETKERQEADSPFGFNLSWDDLTPRQMAIAAALFITRA